MRDRDWGYIAACTLTVLLMLGEVWRWHGKLCLPANPAHRQKLPGGTPPEGGWGRWGFPSSLLLYALKFELMTP